METKKLFLLIRYLKTFRWKITFKSSHIRSDSFVNDPDRIYVGQSEHFFLQYFIVVTYDVNSNRTCAVPTLKLRSNVKSRTWKSAIWHFDWLILKLIRLVVVMFTGACLSDQPCFAYYEYRVLLKYNTTSN